MTAEEVNVVPLADLLDLSVIENFGWGVDGQTKDGVAFAREGEAGETVLLRTIPS